MEVTTRAKVFLYEKRMLVIAYAVGVVAAALFTSYTVTETYVAAQLAGVVSVRLWLGSSTLLPSYAIAFLLGWGIKSVVSLCFLMVVSASSLVTETDEEADAD